MSMIGTWALMTLLRIYQRFFSPLFPPRCRFYPTCSEYALQSIAFYGPVCGLGKALWRLLRCHPLSRGGVDLPTPAGDGSPRGRR
jgi:putative membrane protein insertion efficiency factor